MSDKVFELSGEDLAKVIAVSIMGFGESMGINLPNDTVKRIKDSTVKAINLFPEGNSPDNEDFAQEFIRIYDEDVVA